MGSIVMSDVILGRLIGAQDLGHAMMNFNLTLEVANKRRPQQGTL
jgi:hypothetical protein